MGGKGSWGWGAPSGYASFGTGSLDGVRHLPDARKEEVDTFIAAHPQLDGKSKKRLNELHPKFQTLVMMQGTLHDTDNPSSVLQRRCKIANLMKPGDWICPKCSGVRLESSNCNKCN